MKNFKLIDSYFGGALNEKQMLAFERKMERDEELANEVESYKASQNLIEAIIQDNLRKSLHNLEATHGENTPRIASHNSDNDVQFEVTADSHSHSFSPGESKKEEPLVTSHHLNNHKPSTRSVFSGMRRVAASAILVLCIGGIWLYNGMKNDFSNITTEHLVFTEYHQVRSADEYQITIAQIAALEKTKDFKGANELIAEKIATNSEIYSNLMYFYGQNLFRMKEFDESAEVFQQIIQSDDRRFTESAQLMTVFIDIENKQYTKALSTIASLEADPNFTMKTKLTQIKQAVERRL